MSLNYTDIVNKLNSTLGETYVFDQKYWFEYSTDGDAHHMSFNDITLYSSVEDEYENWLESEDLFITKILSRLNYHINEMRKYHSILTNGDNDGW